MRKALGAFAVECMLVGAVVAACETLSLPADEPRASPHAPRDAAASPAAADAAAPRADGPRRAVDAAPRLDAPPAVPDAAPVPAVDAGPLPSLCATDEDCGATHCCAHMASIGWAGRCIPLAQAGARAACDVLPP